MLSDAERGDLLDPSALPQELRDQLERSKKSAVDQYAQMRIDRRALRKQVVEAAAKAQANGQEAPKTDIELGGDDDEEEEEEKETETEEKEIEEAKVADKPVDVDLTTDNKRPTDATDEEKVIKRRIVLEEVDEKEPAQKEEEKPAKRRISLQDVQ